jgi:hypothetical protein
MAYMTLLEAARGMEPSRERGIIEIYARENQILTVAPIQPTGAVKLWKVQDALPYTTAATGTRAVNGDFTASTGRSKAYEAKCKIYGGKIQVDRYIQHNYPDSVAEDEVGQISALARQLFIDVFEGSGSQYLRGIKDWSTYDSSYTGQEVDAGATTTPVVVTCDALDELISKVDVIPGRTFLYMNDYPFRKIKKDNRGGVSGAFNVQYTPEQIGHFAGMYDNIPIVVTRDGKGANLLSITETDKSGGSSNSQSVYCVTWGPEACQLFSSNSSGIPGIIPMKDGSNFNYEVLEWYIGLAPRKPRSFARLKYVKNALS